MYIVQSESNELCEGEWGSTYPNICLYLQVVFRPDKPSQFFHAELEGYVFYSTQRDHRLHDERLVALPWCITANVSGMWSIWIKINNVDSDLKTPDLRDNLIIVTAQPN